MERHAHNLKDKKMSSKLITEDVWNALSKAARRSNTPADVAVLAKSAVALRFLCLASKPNAVINSSGASSSSGEDRKLEPDGSMGRHSNSRAGNMACLGASDHNDHTRRALTLRNFWLHC